MKQDREILYQLLSLKLKNQLMTDEQLVAFERRGSVVENKVLYDEFVQT